ncbi:MAG: hypothetical protein V1904_15015 [Bacteroidota bacterium]
MKRLIFFLFLILLCISLFEQCKKEGKFLGTIEFSEEGKNIILYKGGEHLVFADTTGDTIDFTIEKPTYIFINKYVPESGDYYKTEYCNIKPINIYLYFPFPYETPLQIVFGIDRFKISSHPEIEGVFSGEWLYDSSKLLQLNSGWFSGITYYDSLVITNKKFYSVYDLDGWANSTDSTEMYRHIYYSIQQGVVGIKTIRGIGNGSTWCLQ